MLDETNKNAAELFLSDLEVMHWVLLTPNHSLWTSGSCAVVMMENLKLASSTKTRGGGKEVEAADSFTAAVDK